MLHTQFCTCRCSLTHNFFLKRFSLHVTYINKSQFIQEYSKDKVNIPDFDPERAIPEIEEEFQRRKQYHTDSWARRESIVNEYDRLHPQLWRVKPSYFAPEFLKLVEESKNTSSVDSLKSFLTNHGDRIYSIPVFTPAFCKLLVEELKHFEASPLPKGRPNTMNSYGINLGELGFDDFISTLRLEYLMPVATVLYPDWVGDSLDSHKAFVVVYKEGQDVDLGYHYDNAEVTLNVALNDNYSEGDIYFGGMRGEEETGRVKGGYSHQLGRGLFHRGRHMHGALPITHGERYNLIIWMRSSSVRNVECPMCGDVPNLTPVENGYGDGFTIVSTQVCTLS
ncbi:2-oxoglutarate and iron-dependent oxygenase domain-containing protein 2-like [Oratosquilla oratoria]|uniref:2-oxoglutarate and iron-dependent oxygenase domain-containing protein 2-like n=1 Tax=Oratosquilla oratoria TaxID=337810 RepID=UPI003F7690E6